MYEIEIGQEVVRICVKKENIHKYKDFEPVVENLKEQLKNSYGIKTFTPIDLELLSIQYEYFKGTLKHLFFVWESNNELLDDTTLELSFFPDRIKLFTRKKSTSIIEFSPYIKYAFRTSNLIKETYNGLFFFYKNYKYGIISVGTSKTSTYVKSVLLKRKNIRNFLNKYKIR